MLFRSPSDWYAGLGGKIRIAGANANVGRVRINDLNAYVTPRLGTLQKPKDLHYTDEGSAFLAKKVAAEIEAVLPKPSN